MIWTSLIFGLLLNTQQKKEKKINSVKNIEIKKRKCKKKKTYQKLFHWSARSIERWSLMHSSLRILFDAFWFFFILFCFVLKKKSFVLFSMLFSHQFPMRNDQTTNGWNTYTQKNIKIRECLAKYIWFDFLFLFLFSLISFFSFWFLVLFILHL